MATTVLNYLQPLQHPDLTLYANRGFGVDVAPMYIHYNLYQVVNGARRLVQAKGVPASDVTGAYYILGRAGEQGQPGDWEVEWVLRFEELSLPEIQSMTFRVLDRVLADEPLVKEPRQVKRGWT